jgi:hypothetical protein
MTDETTKRPLLERLEKFGDAHDTDDWTAGEVDYVAKLGLTAADVPELLAIARKWAEPMDWPDDKNYIAGYAPVHAWRCLAQLGAAEAIPVLLDMMEPLDKNGDDWYLNEFQVAFAMIGPASFGPLRAYLVDTAHALYPRATAADGLKELAERHPQTRDEVVKALCDALSPFQETDTSLNAFVICDLLDLKATDAAELIERVFAADRVDITISGNWNDLREELGVEGLGLVPKHLASQRRSLFPRGLEEGIRDMEESLPAEDDEDSAGPIKASPKIGRNEPCPCGSGKKYKKCCGS